MFDHEIRAAAEHVLVACRKKKLKVVTAESCTGGLLANSFTDVPGASKVFAGSAVCYANDAKVNLLGIPECLIAQHGAVCGSDHTAHPGVGRCQPQGLAGQVQGAVQGRGV